MYKKLQKHLSLLLTKFKHQSNQMKPKNNKQLLIHNTKAKQEKYQLPYLSPFASPSESPRTLSEIISDEETKIKFALYAHLSGAMSQSLRFQQHLPGKDKKDMLQRRKVVKKKTCKKSDITEVLFWYVYDICRSSKM